MDSVSASIGAIAPSALARLLDDPQNSDKIVLIDGRNLLDHKMAHIRNANHLPNALLMRRRLEQNKIPICEYLRLPDGLESRIDQVIVYDTQSADVEELLRDNFLSLAVQKLVKVFRVVSVLKGGFTSFTCSFPHLCKEEAPAPVLPAISQPSMSIMSNDGPTRIFPYLYLGSERDAMSLDVIKSKHISYVLNVSHNCPKADFIQDSHFMRIPVNDTYSDKLLCHFMDAFKFLDKVKTAGGCVLVHCMAGVSRSPTLAIAYVMYSQNMAYDEAYKYVKEKRPAISPNFNFLGQLLEYERTRNSKNGCSQSEAVKITVQDSPKKHSALALSDQSCKRQRLLNSSLTDKPRINIELATANKYKHFDGKRDDVSPSTALARISLNTATTAEA